MLPPPLIPCVIRVPAMGAIALRRAFGRAGLEVEWIETPGDIPAHRTLAGLPNLQAFHRLLGLDANALLRATQGAYSLGQQYVGVSGGESEFLHSYGPIGRPIAGLPFMQFWLKARAGGLPAKLVDFAREAVAARNGRLRTADGPNGAATAQGCHYDARRHAAALRGHALSQGIAITTDPVQHVLIDGEPFGETPVTIETLPRALTVIAPPPATAEGPPVEAPLLGLPELEVDGRALG